MLALVTFALTCALIFALAGHLRLCPLCLSASVSVINGQRVSERPVYHGVILSVVSKHHSNPPPPLTPTAAPSCRPSCGAGVSLLHPFNLPSASQQACSYNTGPCWCANPLSSPDPLKAGAIRETTVKSLPAAVTAELIPACCGRVGGGAVDRSEAGRWVDGRMHCCVFTPGHKAVFLLKSRPSLRIMSAPGDSAPQRVIALM